jgi:hypothetical protein
MTKQWKKAKKAQKTKWYGQYPPVAKLVYLTYEEIIETARDRESGLAAEQVKTG